MCQLFKQGAVSLVFVFLFAIATNANALPAPSNEVAGLDQPIVDLNPQPEPPSLDVDYSLTFGDGGWFGMVYVGGQACGMMSMIPTASKQTGVATHVNFNLSIIGDNPDFALDASLAGVVVQQKVVLNGMVENGFYAGTTIHPRGTIQGLGSGVPIDQLPTLQGTVKLNPQPEPPSFEYPPSPCGE